MFSGKLPGDFLDMLRDTIGEGGLREYLGALERGRVYGVRANLLKISPQGLQERLPYLTCAIPWHCGGFYCPPEERPAKSVWYHAGLFYAQEPSAMLPASVAGAGPGHAVLDLCAAPGGKTTQVAGPMQNEGLIIANDVSISRCMPLVKNIELSGATNSAVLCEKPERLAERFPNFFDRVLIDAPCSGEGMFRKQPGAISSWSSHKPTACAAVQRSLLNQAAIMLKPGGRVVYSTCTFEPQENEGMIEWFLKSHEGFSIIPLNCAELGITAAQTGAGRIWPHLQEGEGHFACVVEKPGKPGPARETRQPRPIRGIEYFRAFCEEYLTKEITGDLIAAGESLYRVPHGLPDLAGIRVVRGGWHLGELKGKRFEPSQAFAMGLKMADARNTINFGAASRGAERYLKGESFDADAPDGWALACVDGFPLGWAKVKGGRMKNKYLKSWVMG